MAARTSFRGRDSIEYSFWLVFADDGAMRFARTQPSIGRGERAMACTATLPLSLFRVPELRATIAIDDPAGGAFKIDVEAASEALKAVVGCDIDLTVRQADAE